MIVSLRLTPIYESTVTIDIDRQMPTGVLGQEATRSAANDADQFLATQVKLIQSDSVLRPVVDKFHLREVEKDALEEAVDQSATSLEAPVILKHLKVTRPPNTYILQISYRSSNRQLAADVANEIALSYLAHTYRIRYKATASLSDFMERQLEELKAKMEKSSAARGAVRARAERHQSGREDQHSFGAPAATEQRIHQSAGRSGAQGSGL